MRRKPDSIMLIQGEPDKGLLELVKIKRELETLWKLWLEQT